MLCFIHLELTSICYRKRPSILALEVGVGNKIEMLLSLLNITSLPLGFVIEELFHWVLKDFWNYVALRF